MVSSSIAYSNRTALIASILYSETDVTGLLLALALQLEYGSLSLDIVNNVCTPPYIYILLKSNGQIINHLLDVFYIIINLGCFRLVTAMFSG